MKYIYFDIYAGFDLQMILGSLYDMTKDAVTPQNAARAILPGSTFFAEETKRQSMEACFAKFEFSSDKTEGSLKEEIENSTLSDETKALLKRWIVIRDDGMNRPFFDDMCELCYCAACLEMIQSLKADKIFVSALNQGSNVVIDGETIRSVPSHHTGLLQKMVNIPVFSVDEPWEILTPGALGLLYVLSAEHMSPRAHNVIKSGYGAGKENLSMPNLARCVLAKNDEDELILDAECVFSEFALETEIFTTSEG